MKNMIEFVYSQEGIEAMKEFAGSSVGAFIKDRSMFAIGHCIIDGKTVFEGNHVIKTEEGFVILGASQKRHRP